MRYGKKEAKQTMQAQTPDFSYLVVSLNLLCISATETIPLP